MKKYVLRINGRRVSRRRFFQRRFLVKAPSHKPAYSEAKPLESIGLSCHPEDAAERNEDAKRLGIAGISWDKRGRCKITSRQARKKWLNANRLHDGDGGYGDG